jgi:protein-disulfide isomerase
MNWVRSLAWIGIGLLGIQLVSAQTTTSPDVSRAVELMIRLRFDVPTICDIKIASRMPSQFTGYDALKVVLSQGGKSTNLDLLISKDNKSLARLDNFDLDHNPALSISTQGRPIRGNPSAQVTVINFDDLECPVCAHMHEMLMSEVTKRYGNKVRFIYKDNPLTEIHPWAMHAAVDAGCLAQQDGNAYWKFVDYVHTHGQEVSGADRNLGRSFSVLDRMASDAGQGHEVIKPVLIACMKKQDETPVRQSMREARGMGLDFTPALFVNGELVRGLTSPDAPQLAIDRALQTKKAK